MKRVIFTLANLLIVILLFAQAPEKMSYQAVVRNAAGELVVNKSVSVFLAIQKKSETATIPMTVYQEKHQVTTNANGLITLQIGAGTTSFPYHALSFSQIKWEEGPMYIKALFDPTGGTNYTITSESQLLSVPYALYAKSAGNTAEKAVLGEMKYFNGADWITIVPNVDGKVLTMENQMPVWKNPDTNGNLVGEMKYWNGAKWITVVPNVDGKVLTIENQIPVWKNPNTNGSLVGEMKYWNGVDWLSVPPSLENKYLTIVNGQPTWRDFSNPVELPQLTTKPASNITIVSATCGGAVVSNGGGTVFERGICFNTSPNPTVNNNVVPCGAGVGSFNATLTGLLPQRAYWVRSYAINEKGIVYGDYIHFQTPTIEIGSDFQGGKLLHVFTPGEPGYVAGEVHGIVMAPFDQTHRIAWACCGWYSGTGVREAIALGLGEINTNLIISKIGNENSLAAVICYNLELNGYDDWYLPSNEELDLIITEKSKLGNFPADKYWSSCETYYVAPDDDHTHVLDRHAWVLRISTGEFISQDKSDLAAGVRAFRNF